MRYLYLLVFIISFLTSCTNSQSEKDIGSLIDFGYSDKNAVPERKVPAHAIKSTSKVHYGIDVSHFQGTVVESIKSSDSLRFVICKATQGDYFVDPDFRINWREIQEKGLIRGTYHFYDCSDDPVKQAEHFTSTASDIRSADIAPILDIEQGSMTDSVSGEQMVKDILVFLQTVEKITNRKPILYTDYAFAQEYFKNTKLEEYDLWLAEYSGGKKPLIPNEWEEKGFKIWQKSDSYHAYSTTLDYDVFFGDLSDLVK